ncbi:hypothetical protein V8C42DRAFT_350479 [Trichoderma barbatum]
MSSISSESVSPRERATPFTSCSRNGKRASSDIYPPGAPTFLHNDYTIGWICALHIEMAAARAMLDCVHKPLPMDAKDSNAYVLGHIGPHNIVMACLPVNQYGTNNAANVASNMNRSFPSIRVRLMVGIGGGVPSSNYDVRLGDVVVGCRVMQYDMGKIVGDGKMVRTAMPRITPPDHSTHVSILRAIHEMKPTRVPYILQEMHDKYPGMTKYTYPTSSPDRLFRAAYDHDPDAVDCSTCIHIEAAHTKTCHWLLDHPTFLEWLENEKLSKHYGVLWLSGKPGAGKSTIMKFVSTRLKEVEDITSATISFFFNARGELLEKSTTGMYQSLLLQLLEAFPDLQRVLDDLALIPENRHHCPTTSVIRKLFHNAVRLLNSRAITCIIDALDECDEQQVRDMVDYFEELGREALKDNIQLRICFSSRHYPYIYVEHALRLTLEDQIGHSQDLVEYVKSRFKPNSDLFGDVQAQILQKAAGVFMWVVLVVNILNVEFDRGRIFAVRKRLQQMPAGLSDLFKSILKRDNENMQELLLCIQWLLYAKRPLKPEEFYFAVLSGLPDDILLECDTCQVTSGIMEKFVVSSSKGLAEVTKSEFPTVQFIHESNPFLSRLELPHLITLNSFNGSHYWSHTPDSSLIYILAAEGLSNLIRAWPVQNSHVCVHRARYLYPLYAALVNGRGDAVRALLGRNTYSTVEEDILRPLKFGVYGAIAKRQTPLHWVVSNDREITVRQLLKIGADINARDSKGNTPLLLSLHHGHDAMMKLLIEHGADIDARDNGGRTALLMATKYDNQVIVLLLLENGADINARDHVGRTALLMAIIYRNQAIAKLLVEKGADVDAKDCFGNTALKLAVLYENEATVKLLIENGAEGSELESPLKRVLECPLEKY